MKKIQDSKKIDPKISNGKIDIITEALMEDIGAGDITTNSIIPKDKTAHAVMKAKASGIIAGLPLAEEVFKRIDPNIIFSKRMNDGDIVKNGDIIAEVDGNARSILTAERLALNLVQRLSGIATLTSQFVKLSGKAKILDTRKTTPLLRKFERYAVVVGGGCNHRFNLNDQVLIKDNHIDVAGGIKQAIRLAKTSGKKIEVEVRNLKELREALDEGVFRIMLDNMSLSDMRQAVKICNHKVELEASGGVNIATIKDIAATGVDYVSVGALTHSAKALDISLKITIK